jgi:dUTP pyrophosphatase
MDDRKLLLEVKLLKPKAQVPNRLTEGSAGFDLFAAESVIVPAASIVSGHVSIGRALVPIGIAISIPGNCVGRIGSRSGLSVNKNIEVGAGWIDSDYRGEVCVELKNLSPQDFAVAVGMRIAQLFVLPLAMVDICCVSELPSSERGQGGFGSSGL